MVAFPDLHEHLSDGVVALRPAAERDIPDILVAYQDDPEMHRRFGAERPPSAAELGRRAEQAEAVRVAGLGLTLTILEVGSDVCRGELNVHHVELEQARGELGLWLAPGARHRGFGTRTLRLAVPWLIGRCGFERLAVHTDPDNTAMRGAAEAAGFQFEGILRGYTLEHGRRVDNAVLSFVAGDE